MRLEKYEPGLDEPTCQDVHMPALSIPPGQAFLVKVELSPPPATGVMGTIGQLLGGGEDDQKDPVARMFKVGRQTHPILRLENPFSTRQVQAKVYICVLERAGTATEHEGSHDSGPMPPPHEMLRELSASLLKALRDPDETDALLSRACRMRGQLGLRPQAPRQTRTPAVVSGQPVSGEAKWGAGSPAMLLEFAMPKQALESAIQIHDAEMRVAKLEEQLLDVRKQLQTAQVHADLAFRALQLGVRLGPGKSRREESEE
ncbi:hypothetical protein FNF31_05871 [Cafeteria roenbergensis]|uniref:Uncharacterized protein n=1 Tax=Cafeteria roenbergensis TaxID=33653 RepID=A0A5A8CUU5_CAFRO|nr:hypothetical protein FNF31_05871 [Cafeteria roenbergensis]